MKSASGRLSRNNVFIQAFVLLTSILIVYFGIWNAFFAGRDDFGIMGIMRRRSTIFDVLRGYGSGVRFLSYALIWVKIKLFGLSSAPYFWISLLQHMIVTLIVYYLVGLWSRRRTIPFLAALLFATSFSHYTVVTLIMQSNYSQRAILYLATLALFAVYLEQRRSALYWGSVAVYALLAFTSDYALSVPLILLAYDLTLGRGARKIFSLGWADLRLHLPFWILWAIHVAIQMSYVFAGTSEALYSEQAYEPGFHMIANLKYLIFLGIPDAHSAPIFNFLTTYLSSGMVDTIWQLSMGLAVVGNLLAAILLLKGSSLVRFALALIYLPFFQYTLWRGGFAGAPRYRYLPAIGFSILLALLLTKLYDYLCRKDQTLYQLIVPGVVTIIVTGNLIFNQVWVQRHIDNGRFRRAVVSQLEKDWQDVEPGAQIIFEVPKEKFTDLESACRLVLPQSVHCEAFVVGERSMVNVIGDSLETPVYWLQVTSDGINQKYPASSILQ